jgi:hypothetical protein
MVRRLGLVLVGLLGCGDDLTRPPANLIGDLTVATVATMSPDDVLGLAIAALDARTFVLARAETRGFDFCPQCLDPESKDCAAICRRAVIDVTRQDAEGNTDPPDRVVEVFPRTTAHDVNAVEVVALDDTHVGVAWLDCDNATCGPSTAKRSCTAQYTTLDLLTGRASSIETLYHGWYGDLQLAFDRRTRQLLALVGVQRASGAGVRAAIYNELASMQVAQWQPYGGGFARAPVATASASGFVVVADDPSPSEPAPAEPCAEACDCQGSVPPDPAAGGLYAFRPGVDRPAERIAPGRGVDGAYRPREAIAAVDAGGRVVVATSQSHNRSAELFEQVLGGWGRRHVSRAPVPAWIGAFGDLDHLAWLGSEPDPDSPTEERLVAGISLIDGVSPDDVIEQRGDLTMMNAGLVTQAAPIAATGNAVTATYLLRAVSVPGGGEALERFEVLRVHADW